MPRKIRDYKFEYNTYHKKPENLAKSRKRKNARYHAEKMGLVKKGDRTREVDHKKPLSKGGGNGHGNIRIVSRTANRKKYNKKKASPPKPNRKRKKMRSRRAMMGHQEG